MKKFFFTLLFLLIPYIFVFQAFFIDKSLSWGDAPYYYSENLKELFNPPFLWDFRNVNFGSPQAGILWLYLPTYLFGILNNLFNFSSETLIRLIFYFPATLLSIIGTFLLLSKAAKNLWAKILGVSFYLFNTYILMVLDGGQIGVGLSYGFFPIVVYLIDNFLSIPRKRNFVLGLFGFFLLTNIDLRIAIICLFTSLIYFYLLKSSNTNQQDLKKNLINIGMLVFTTMLLNSFWVLPFILNQGEYPGGRFTQVIDVSNKITILDSLFFYQPHFPFNEFGKVSPPPFYFGFLPVIIFIPLFIFKKKLILFLLCLIFLAKGQSPPLGGIYGFLVNSLPLGEAFRDSTKFYIPLMLTTSLLLSLSSERLIHLIKYKKFQIAFFLIFFVYLLLLIQPALLGQLTGSLSLNKDDESFKIIYQNIKNEQVLFFGNEGQFFRTIWFSEVPPLAFSSINNPAIYGNRLYQQRPFASMIDGDYDLYNFFHHPNFSDWVVLSGGRFLFFPENERLKLKTDKQIEERKQFLKFIDNLSNFERLSWGASFPGYKITKESKPHIFGQKKSYIVIGGDEIYQKLFAKENFDLASQGFLFAEGCNFDVRQILEFDSSSINVILSNKGLQDLVMTLLCDEFIDTTKATFNQWAKRDSGQYLKWKSELLERGIRTYEYDLGKGISYSTIPNEKMEFDINLKANNEYFLATRFLTAKGSGGLTLKIKDKEFNLKSESSNLFSWEILGPFKLNRGNYNLEVINNGGLAILNTVAIIAKEDYIRAQNLGQKIVNNFDTYQLDEDLPKILDTLDENFIRLDYLALNPTEYRLTIPKNVNWVVFSDNFHPGWEVSTKRGRSYSLPFYSMFNGFYVYSINDSSEGRIFFSPQRIIPLSTIISLVAFLLLVTYLFLVRVKTESGLNKLPPSERKSLKEIHEDVPPDHYDQGIKNNIFQRYWHKKRFKKVLEKVSTVNGLILDVGCHSGLFTQKIARASEAYKVYGVDISKDAIQRAKLRIKGGTFRVADAHSLPFKDNFFNAVFCIEVLEHVENPNQVVKEIYRVLKRGGYGLILIPTDNFLFRAIWWIWNRLYPVWKHAHIQSFQNDQLDQLITRRKFKILDIDTFNLKMLKIIKFQKV